MFYVVSLNWLPNAICIGRVILVGPIVVAMLKENYTIALILIGIAGCSDALDVMLARNSAFLEEGHSLLTITRMM